MNKKSVEVKGSNRIFASLVLGFYFISFSPVYLFAKDNQLKKENQAFINAVKEEINLEKLSEPSIEEISELYITASDGGKVELGKASVEIPAGALKKDTTISITHLNRVEETGESLFNAIPDLRGYRFLPAGTKFKKEVIVTLPYDSSLNSKPQSLEDLYTYFFDTKKKVWVKLDRIEVDRENCVVRSLTTHFTDMINATLTLPESANPSDVNLNSIKNLEAAKPDSHLIKFNPPKASNTGDANFSFELSIPAGRQGMQPQLVVSYSSDGGNGIMGKGFDVRYGSSITTDTRFGLPTYTDYKTDRYMLDGILLKYDEKSDLVNNGYIEYYPLKESSFERIRRYISDLNNFNYWEITSKNGTKRIFGNTESSCVGCNQEIFTWNLTKVIDVYSNTVIYDYDKDETGYVYPKQIKYTGNEKQNNDAHYFIDFEYDLTRSDVRLDARSGKVVECNRLLKNIKVSYKNSENGRSDTDSLLNTYNFYYKESSASQKMMTALEVVNSEGENYIYSFDYNPEGQFFADGELWTNGQPIQTGNSTSFGANFNAAGGAGYGTRYLDARLTTGASGSASSGKSYSEDSMVDVNGDGLVDAVYNGKDGYIYVALNNGSGFNDPDKIEVTTEINRERNSSTSIGWNVYGGIGVKGNSFSADAGGSFSQSYQNSISNSEVAFMDMDGDGLVDIVESGKDTYLKNIGGLKFSSTPVYKTKDAKLIDAVQVFSEKEINDYKETYYVQTPFREWKVPYNGKIAIKQTVNRIGKKADDVALKIFYSGNKGTTTITSNSLDVKQSKSLYFISDTGDDPKDKDIEWKIDVDYTNAELFNIDNLKGPLVFCDYVSYILNGETFKTQIQTINVRYDEKELREKNYKKDINNKIKIVLDDCNALDFFEFISVDYDLYENYIGEDNSKKYFAKVKDISLNKDISKMIERGLFLPGVLTPIQFVTYKNQLTASKEDAEIKFYQNFAKQFVYSVTDDLFILREFKDNTAAYDFYKEYTPDYTALILSEKQEKTFLESYLANYKLYGISADFTEDEKKYTNCATYYSENIYRTGVDIGDSYLNNNNEQIIVLSKNQDTNSLILYNVDNQNILSSENSLLISEVNRDENESIKLKVECKDGDAQIYSLDIKLADVNKRSYYISNFEYEKIIDSIKENEYPELKIFNPENKLYSITEEDSVTNIKVQFPHLQLSNEEWEQFVSCMYDYMPNQDGGESYYISKKNPDYGNAKDLLKSNIKKYIEENIFNFYQKSENGYILKDYWKNELSEDEYISDSFNGEMEIAKKDYASFTNQPILNQINCYLEKGYANLCGNDCVSLFNEYKNSDFKNSDILTDYLNECFELYTQDIATERLKVKYTSDYLIKNSRLLNKCLEFKLFKYNNVDYRIEYNKNYAYPVVEGKSLIPVLSTNCKIGKQELSIKLRWSSSEISNDNNNLRKDYYEKIPAKEEYQNHQVYFYEETDSTYSTEKFVDVIEVSSNNVLYGGKNNWFVGIWEGDVSKFTCEQFNYTIENNDNLYDVDKIKNQSNNNKEAVKKLDDESEKQQGNVHFYLPVKSSDSTIINTKDNNFYDFHGYSLDSIEKGLIGNVAIDTHYEYRNDEKVVVKDYYMPFISCDYIHADRAGGLAYYNIDGLYTRNDKNDNFSLPKIRKTYTTGKDTTPSLSIGVGVVKPFKLINLDELGNELLKGENAVSIPAGAYSQSWGKNESKSKNVQAFMDLNGDGIPDFIQVNEDFDDTKNNLSVTYGKRYTDENQLDTIRFENTSDGIKPEYISYNKTTTYVNGCSPNLGGLVEIAIKGSGKFTEARQKASTNPSSSSTASSGTSEQTKGIIELNGDGLPDYYDGSTVYLNTGKEFISIENLFEDIDLLTSSQSESKGYNFSLSFGDSKKIDTLKANSLSSGVSASIGGSYSASSTNSHKMMLDINGDGLPDIVSMKPGSEIISVKYNTGKGFTNSKEVLLQKWDLEKLGQTISSDLDLTNPFLYQKDNDGFEMGLLTDLPVVGDFISEGTRNIALNPYGIKSKLETNINALDWNSSVTLGLNGSVGANVNIGIDIWGLFAYLGTVNITASAGAGVNASTTVNGINVSMTDLDGDGLPDQVLRIPGVGTYWKRNISGTFGQLVGINLPQGGNIEIEYKGCHGTVSMPGYKYVMSAMTVNDGCGKTHGIIDHKNHSVRTTYDYSDGYYDRKEKESYGYRIVQTITNNTKTIEEYCQKVYAAKGLVAKTTIKDSKENIISEKNTLPYCLLKNAEVARLTWSMPIKEVSKTYEAASGNNCVETIELYKYDEKGNCNYIKQIYDSENYLEAYIDYIDVNSDEYIVGLPEVISVYDKNGIVRKRKGVYNPTGKLQKLYQYSDKDELNYSYNSLDYDSYGNIEVVKQKQSEYDSEETCLYYTYDSAEHMFVTMVVQQGTGTAKYISNIKYDEKYQLKIFEEDCNRNYIEYTYDGWKRPLTVTTSYDKGGKIPAVKYEYYSPSSIIFNEQGKIEILKNKPLWHAITDNKVTFSSKDSKVIKTIVESDGLGRAVRTAKTGYVYKNDQFISGWNVSGAVEYDESGRTVKHGVTEFISGNIDALFAEVPKVTELFTGYEYDDLDRPVKTVLPDGTETSVSYSITDDGKLQTISLDPYGQKTVQKSDSRGNIISVQKYSSEKIITDDGNEILRPEKLLSNVSYEYNAMSEMVKAYNIASRPVVVTYDLLGRRISIESKDSGRQEFRYDNKSNLIGETNSVLKNVNKEILYKYDNLNRLILIDYPDTENTEYVYGLPDDVDKAAGKIKKVTDASGSIEYKYGSLGQIVEENRTIKTHLNGGGKISATMKYETDYLGRMQSITYPDGEVVTYEYDDGGQITKVSGLHAGHNEVYVNQIGYDEYGQRIFIEYGNGVKTYYEYDSARRWLKNIKTSNKYQYFQNINYSFDKVGNVKGYVNDCHEEVNGKYRTEQEYCYDDLYQLISVHGKTTYDPYYSVRPEFVSEYTQTFEFDNTYKNAGNDSMLLGRMTSKISNENTSTFRTYGDNLNYSLQYSYDNDYSYRIKNVGERYYKYDLNGNIICEQNGAFDSDNEEYGILINNEADDVYSTEYAWGTYRESTDNIIELKKAKREYTWNERNQLINSKDSVYNTFYVYGQDGQRSNKYTGNSETLYFNNMWVIHEDSGNSLYSGQCVKNIYLGETRILTRLHSGQHMNDCSEEINRQYYYHSDHLGSASLITDYKGDQYQRIEYTPYGETWIELTDNKGLEYLPYKFTAKELDEETGLYYYGARYLDPKYSVWLSTDPALGDYIPGAGKANSKDSGNLPGMGGVFNHINFNLYHYAGNNPVKYTDPDGNADKYSYVKNSFSGSTTTTATSVKTSIEISDLKQLIDNTGKAWAAEDSKVSVMDVLQSTVDVTSTSLSVADLLGLALIPPPYDVIVSGTLLVADFLIDSANQDQLGNQLKGMYKFENKLDKFSSKDGWSMTELSVTETVISKETYYDRNSPFTTKKEKQYLELQATFYNKEKDEYGYAYQLLELN